MSNNLDYWYSPRYFSRVCLNLKTRILDFETGPYQGKTFALSSLNVQSDPVVIHGRSQDGERINLASGAAAYDLREQIDGTAVFFLSNNAIVFDPCKYEEIGKCRDCQYYHGSIFEGRRLICAIHPYGKSSCPDFVACSCS